MAVSLPEYGYPTNPSNKVIDKHTLWANYANGTWKVLYIACDYRFIRILAICNM